MTRFYLQILGTTTGDSTPSVFVMLNKTRYLFNVGDGTQRFCGEHRIKLSKLKRVLLTRLCTSTLGGLPGMLAPATVSS